MSQAPKITTLGCRLNAYESEAMRALAEHAISIEAIVQKELPSPVSTTTVIILTQPVPERVAAAACAQIEALSAVSDTVHRIRVEHFDE